MKRCGVLGRRRLLAWKPRRETQGCGEPSESARHDGVQEGGGRPAVRGAQGGEPAAGPGVCVARAEHGSGVQGRESPPGLSRSFSFLLLILALKFL